MANIRLKSVRDSCEALNASRAVCLLADIVLLLEDELARAALDGAQSPGGEVGAGREVDFLGPAVASLKREREPLVDAAAAAVCPAPVGRVGDEVEDEVMLNSPMVN